LQASVGAGRHFRSGRAVARLAADVIALPVDLGAGQAIGEAAAEKRQVRHIGRLGGIRRSAHHSHQQESTHRNAPSDTLNLALIIAC
jgi:hypothetical protein